MNIGIYVLLSDQHSLCGVCNACKLTWLSVTAYGICYEGIGEELFCAVNSENVDMCPALISAAARHVESVLQASPALLRQIGCRCIEFIMAQMSPSAKLRSCFITVMPLVCTCCSALPQQQGRQKR